MGEERAGLMGKGLKGAGELLEGEKSPAISINRERRREFRGEEEADRWDPPGSERKRRARLGWFGCCSG
jgi:hypothetical protein